MFDSDPTAGPIVLDGGLSTALEQQGADLGGALWTARLLGEEPERIARAHRDYFRAGARVATTASYPASVEGLVAAGYDAAAARRLITSSVTLAREVRDEMADTHPGLLVAASVGPYGAFLADGSEYRGRYGVSPARLREFHAPRLELLAAAGPDLLAVETIPDSDEAEVLVALLDDLGVPAWFSYSVRGATTNAGQPLADAYAVLAGSRSVLAAGVNCSEQGDVLGAVREAVAATGLPAVAYPNRGGSWDSDAKAWAYGEPLDLDLVEGWVAAGARFIGGCCGTGPSDIAVLADRVAGHTADMAYDVELADRIREVVQAEPGLSEKRMFGGLAFLVNGNMAVSASSRGGLLLRVDPARTESLVDGEHVRRFEMRGREMDGWLDVDVEAVPTDDALQRWVEHGLAYARSLPPK